MRPAGGAPTDSHLSWRNPRKYWVLKIQEPMYKMPGLRAVYPDAIFVQPHRDPTTVIASISQLIRVLRDPVYDHQDLPALGREMVHLWHDGLVSDGKSARASGFADLRHAP
jgi:hypothetical protein